MFLVSLLISVLEILSRADRSKPFQNVQILYDWGYRVIGMTHFFDVKNIAGSNTGVERFGLKDNGKALIRKASQLGMVIDVAHGSEALISDILDQSEKPIMCSHTGIYELCSNKRNLRLDHAKRIAEKGGFVGVAYFPSVLCAPSEGMLDEIIRTILYLGENIGFDSIGLGEKTLE